MYSVLTIPMYLVYLLSWYSVLTSRYSVVFISFQSRYMIVLEQAIMSIASVAEAAKEHFANYYAIFMPQLKTILCQECAPPLRVGVGNLG